jgi:hypothetical protein
LLKLCFNWQKAVAKNTCHFDYRGTCHEQFNDIETIIFVVIYKEPRQVMPVSMLLMQISQ